MRSFLVFALALVACRDATPSKPAVTADGRCVDGWKATKTSWHGTVRETVSFMCDAGVPRMYAARRGRIGLEATPSLHEMSSQTWQRLWKGLEKAGWRRMAAREADKPDVEIEITDGTATTKLEWKEPIRLTDQERDINIYIETAFTLGES